MNWLKKLLGYRTTRSASGALSPFAWSAAAFGFSANLRAAYGADVIAYPVANTNSMLPTFDANAVLLAEKVSFEALREGDIVTYRSGSRLIVHRLNERLKDGWWPLGDANGTMDPQLVTAANFDRRICGILYGAKSADTDN